VDPAAFTDVVAAPAPVGDVPVPEGGELFAEGDTPDAILTAPVPVSAVQLHQDLNVVSTHPSVWKPAQLQLRY
jgi:hypothetical protein